MPLPVSQPFPLFTDKSGDPIDAGSIYVGEPYLNPETNPITVYWDSAGTVPAPQPIRTLNGYPVRDGTPTRFYVGSAYSITIRDKHGQFIFGSLTEEPGNGSQQKLFGTIAELRAATAFGYFTRAITLGYWSPGDTGHGIYDLDASDVSSADDGFLVIVTDDGARMKLKYDESVRLEQAGAISAVIGAVDARINAAAQSLADKHIPIREGKVDFYCDDVLNFVNWTGTLSLIGAAADLTRFIFDNVGDGFNILFAEWRDGNCKLADFGVYAAGTGAMGAAMNIKSTTLVSSATLKGPSVTGLYVATLPGLGKGVTYWTNGIAFENVPHPYVDDNWVEGGVVTPNLGNGIELGDWTTSPTVSHNQIYNWLRGVECNGFQTEGVDISHNHIIACYDGIYADTSAIAQETAFFPRSNEIDCDHWDIYINNRATVNVIDNILYQKADASEHVDIKLVDCDIVQIKENKMRKEVGTNPGYGIVADNCNSILIAGNIARARDYGLVLNSGCARVTYYGNDFDQMAVTEVLDNRASPHVTDIIAGKKALAQSAIQAIVLPAAPQSILTGTETALYTMTERSNYGDAFEMNLNAGPPQVMEFIVKEGVFAIVVEAQVFWQSASAGYRRVRTLLDGSTFDGMIDNIVGSVGGTTLKQYMSSGRIPVTPGQKITFHVTQNSGGALNIEGGVGCWFQLKAVA